MTDDEESGCDGHVDTWDHEPRRSDGGGIKAAWRAEAAEERDRWLEQLRRAGLFLVAAIVLLPPYLLGLLTVAAVLVYICMATMKSIRSA